MQLVTSHSSFRVPSIIPRHCKASSNDNNRFIPINPTTKNIIKSFSFPSKCPTKKVLLPEELYGKSRSRKSLYGQYRSNSIKACGEDESSGPNSVLLAKITRFGSAYYKFTRPYVMLHTILSAVSLFARVLVENPQLFSWSLFFKACCGLTAIILARAYSIGINQIYDLDIDRVNKPYLAIPAGDLSTKQAWLLVISDLIVGLSILRLLDADLITTSLYCLGVFFVTYYSAPPLRFKESSISAITVIVLTSVLLPYVGILHATTRSLGLPIWWSAQNLFIIAFMAIFFIVISITKDITDIEGDIKHNIRTLAAVYGPKNISFLGIGMLLVNYIGATVVAICMPQAFKCHLMLPAHTIFAMWLLFQARKLDKANYTKEASANFYQFLWKLIYLEFFLFPFI